MAEFEHPGVFVEEVPTGMRAIAGVPTGAAAITGYTEKAIDPASGKSLAGIPVRITSHREYEWMFGGASGAGYDLHAAIGLFFANGGTAIFVVSVGPLGPVDAAQLRAGLDALDAESEPAILLAPDALRLARDAYYDFARDMIARAAASRRRTAIVDVHGGGEPGASSATGLAAALADFRAAMAQLPPGVRSYAAAYHPFLLTGSGPAPPSAAVAGVWADTDSKRGVWKAPAGEPLAGVTGLSYAISGATQDGMNAPPDGLSVNAIRSFPGRGIQIRGARTLAGNDNEWRYVNVRRLFLYVEQSIERGVQWAVFEPNAAPTWAAVKATAEIFLFDLWRQGGFQGVKPQEAYFVQVGLGTTMTQADIDAGRIIVEIGMAPIRPAEFIIIRIGLRCQAT